MSVIDRFALHSLLTRLCLAPVEEMSEDESTGGSIPFDNNAGKEDAPNGNDEDEAEDEEGV